MVSSSHVGNQLDPVRQLVMDLVDLVHTYGSESREVACFLKLHEENQVFCARAAWVLPILRGEEELGD